MTRDKQEHNKNYNHHRHGTMARHHCEHMGGGDHGWAAPRVGFMAMMRQIDGALQSEVTRQGHGDDESQWSFHVVCRLEGQ